MLDVFSNVLIKLKQVGAVWRSGCLRLTIILTKNISEKSKTTIKKFVLLLAIKMDNQQTFVDILK